MAQAKTQALVAFVPLFLLILRLSLSTVDAETIEFPWCIPTIGSSYVKQQAKEGDTIVFRWAGEYHNAFLYPSGDCNDSEGGEYLGEQPGASYTFSPEEAGTDVTFVCSVGSHCALGQIVTFAVAAGSSDSANYETSTPCGDVMILSLPEEEDVGVEKDAEEASGATGVSFAAATTTMVVVIVSFSGLVLNWHW